MWKPALNKRFLILIAGMMWIGVGVMLDTFAVSWLIHFGKKTGYYFLGAGLLAALIIHHFGFLKIVDKNLGRISLMKGKPCAFSFMSWKSYLLVTVMVSVGILLRHSNIPKHYLSVLYIGIGTALILSSIRYFRNTFRVSENEHPEGLRK